MFIPFYVMMSDANASCDLQDITRARITQDIGVVAVINTRGILLAISSGHSDRGWIKREVRLDDLERIHVSDVFHEDVVGVIEECVANCAASPKSRTYACDIFFSCRTYVSVLAQPDGKLVIEIEDFDRELLTVNTIVDTANIIGKLSTNTRQVDTINDLCESVFMHCSYDRVMTYKFLDDLSGEVVYELKDDDLVKSSFLGMRFPAGDIPLPARNAYVENPVRFIADVDKPSCKLLQKSEDISLSRSFLRGCEACHISYLKAMGVKSSLSIAITNVEGKLWGLIAMHSYTKPIVPTIEDRVSYAILASVSSSHVQHLENVERLAMETRIKTLLSQIDVKHSLGVFIVQKSKALLKTFNADSVSLFTPDGPPTMVGKNAVTPEEVPDDIVTNSLVCGQLEHPLRSFACIIVLGYKIVFTRMSSYNPESWTGNPKRSNTSEVSSDMVMPAQSFEKYMSHISKNPKSFTERDKVLLSKAGDVLQSAIRQMKLENVERKVDQAKKESHLIEMKSDQDYAFFANMSHELRTPLHAISGVFEIMNDMDHGDVKDERSEAIHKYLSIGQETCKGMMNTLNDILTIVKKTHGNNDMDVSLVMIKEIFNSTSNGLTVFAQKNGVILEIEFDCNADKLVRIDVHKTIQIFNNIGGNAIKFSSSVNIRIDLFDSIKNVKELWMNSSDEYEGRLIATEDWDREESTTLCKWLIFRTRDIGIGIHVYDMRKMFKKFSQIGDIVKKTFASTGLGLHISILNVQAMRGFLAVASTPDKGSLFFCALPVEDASCETKEVVDPITDPAQGLGGDSVTFVVVDDSKVNLMIAKKQITRAFVNAKIYTAVNGKVGVEEVAKLRSEGVDVDGIFMDYHMPVMSGIEASREIRKKDTRVPITMLTADITETSRQSMIASGIDLILLKPSRPHEIVEMCAKMIQHKRSKA